MSPKSSLLSPRFCLLFVSIVATLTLLACQQAAPPTNLAETAATPAPTERGPKAAPTDLAALSNRLVTQVAGVKEGEIVFINGSARDLELLENLNTEVRKVGAFPMITLGSDRIFKKYYAEVPDKYDSQPPDLELKLATMPAVLFTVDTNESDDVSVGIRRHVRQPSEKQMNGS